MATFSIKPILLAIVLTGAVLPLQAVAGPDATQVSTQSSTQASYEMWDVMTPVAEVAITVSHMDIAPGQSFDAPGTVIPMKTEFLTRAEFEKTPGATETWDVTPQTALSTEIGVSHMDVQPGQNFDHPATYAPQAASMFHVASYTTVSTPDA